MNITVTAGDIADDMQAATLTIPAVDVDAAVKKAYKDVAAKYNFQGFRRGHTPRPVIDSIVGREGVLAQATNDLMEAAEPHMFEQLDIVPMGEVDYGEDNPVVEEGADYTIEVKVPVRPTATLSSYDAPAIEMPPAEATEAEIDQQIEQLLSFRTTYEDIEGDRAAQEGDFLMVDIENVENCEQLESKGRMLSLSKGDAPDQIVEGLVGAAKGETKEIAWDETHEHGDHTHETHLAMKVTVNAIRKAVVPEVTDDNVQSDYGFDSVEAMRDAVKLEIEKEKENQLPELKEERALNAMAERLELEEVPEAYVNSVFNETAQQIMGQLSRQGQSLDQFLAMRGITADQFIADLREQSEERARQSMALDAVVAQQGIEATDEDIRAEFERAGSEDVDKSIADFRDAGQLPAVRDSIKRNKALTWMTDNAEVTIVDEIAKRRETDGE